MQNTKYYVNTWSGGTVAVCETVLKEEQDYIYLDKKYKHYLVTQSKTIIGDYQLPSGTNLLSQPNDSLYRIFDTLDEAVIYAQAEVRNRVHNAQADRDKAVNELIQMQISLATNLHTKGFDVPGCDAAMTGHHKLCFGELWVCEVCFTAFCQAEENNNGRCEVCIDM